MCHRPRHELALALVLGLALPAAAAAQESQQLIQGCIHAGETLTFPISARPQDVVFVAGGFGGCKQDCCSNASVVTVRTRDAMGAVIHSSYGLSGDDPFLVDFVTRGMQGPCAHPVSLEIVAAGSTSPDTPYDFTLSVVDRGDTWNTAGLDPASAPVLPDVSTWNGSMNVTQSIPPCSTPVYWAMDLEPGDTYGVDGSVVGGAVFTINLMAPDLASGASLMLGQATEAGKTFSVRRTHNKPAGRYYFKLGSASGNISEYQLTFVRSSGTLDASVAPPAPPASLRLGPNPARDRIALAFELAHDSVIEARILDIAGRRRSELPPQSLARGAHSLDVVLPPVAQLPPGYYVAEVVTRDRVLRKGFLRLR